MVQAADDKPVEITILNASKDANSRSGRTSPAIFYCKINGCKKRFAREADLKRHQRTTKTHSMAGHLCLQCDATFTRADALRRHTKARHKDLDAASSTDPRGDENSGAGTLSNSQTATGKESAAAPEETTPVDTPSGPSTYYRQHTVTMAPHIPPRQRQNSPHSLHHSYVTPGWIATPFYPSPYYRPHTHHFPPPFRLIAVGPQPSPIELQLTSPHPIANMPTSTSRTTDALPISNASSPNTSWIRAHQHPIDASSPASEGTPSMDSNPDSDLDSDSHLTEADVAAVVEAVIKMQAAAAAANGQHSTPKDSDMNDFDTPGSMVSRSRSSPLAHSIVPSPHHDNDRIIDTPAAINFGPDHDLASPTRSSSPMRGLHSSLDSEISNLPSLSVVADVDETFGIDRLGSSTTLGHIFTIEDGAPMLHPDELLSQESFASPPPS